MGIERPSVASGRFGSIVFVISRAIKPAIGALKASNHVPLDFLRRLLEPVDGGGECAKLGND